METLDAKSHTRVPISCSGDVKLNITDEADKRALWAILESMGWMKYVVSEPSCEEILKECCGAWSDDGRTTEDLVAECRSAYGISECHNVAKHHSPG